MNTLSKFILLWIIFIPIFALADENGVKIQLKKEKELVEALKKLVTCKNMGVYEEGDLYCKLSFRGLELELAGVNAKGGGTIYVKSLGNNQTISMRGSRCILVIFDDQDIKGIIGAHILFRNDGVITYNDSNEKAWGECR